MVNGPSPEASVRSSMFPACSEWARTQHLDPVGSAGSYTGFLLVEHPLPWPGDIADIPELAEVSAVAASSGLRVQLLVRGDGQLPTERRALICYRSERPGWAGPLSRADDHAPVASLAERAEALVKAPTPVVTVGSPASMEPTELLVCTHGRRDMCCGARGMELFGSILEHSEGFSRPVRVWRTSHTGGHRFAPTVLLLPSATLWAWADLELVQRAVGQHGPVDSLLGHYRGSALVGSPAGQAAERAVFARVGWPLLHRWRRAIDLGDGRVRLQTEGAGTWEARVREGRHVPQPECRTDPALATKTSTEWVVDDLFQVTAAAEGSRA